MIMKQANLALALVLELGVLATLAFWGIATGSSIPVKIVLGLGAPASAVIVWAIWGAPRSERRLQGLSYWLLRIVFDVAGAVSLYVAGPHLLSIIFALTATLNCILGYVWRQSEMDPRKESNR